MGDSKDLTKQEYHSTLISKWLTLWSNSPRKNRFSCIDPNFLFNKFCKRLYKLTRKQTSLIMQIRTGHIPLNFFLHRINKIDSDKCTNCNNGEEDVPRTETINYFLFDCSAYDDIRRDTIAIVGRNRFNLPSIMSNTDYMKALVTFINRSGRFNNDPH